MKHIILIMALMIGTVSFAQEKLEKKSVTSERNDATIENRIEKQTKELDLSKDQKEQLKAMLLKHDELVKNNQDDASKLEAIDNQTEKEFRSILTPEQIKRFDKLQKEREAKQINGEINLQKTKMQKAPSDAKKQTNSQQK